ncbi:ABC transporter permease [Haloplanus pelagicus]|jgi:peptide/nickel transport system permease protein|uniref:ABC transporter permease n=1 Tax=Haloplanus pelagicus TaxID=2949995 RepID=UPI00203FD85A|nr:ABC transporter permease [Haloplanus sp. HW8-1]
MTGPDPLADRGRLRVRGFEGVDADDGTTDAAPDATASVDRRRRAWRRFRRDRTAVVGLGVIGVMALLALFARPIEVGGVVVQPIALAPYDPAASGVAEPYLSPSLAHPFGTDWAGRDVFSRVLYGGRYSLSIGAIAVGLAVTVGVPLGALAGYVGGWVDETIMRLVDVLYAFPFLVLAIAFVATFGQGFWKLVAALVAVGWISYARLLRGEVLSVVERDYVLAARALGVRDRHVLARHVVPNAVAPVVVQATLNVGTVVLSAAALGFLGLGLPPGTAEWGSMLSAGRDTLVGGEWWVTVFPGLAIFLFVLAINLVGDGVRDALDPDAEGDAYRREAR